MNWTSVSIAVIAGVGLYLLFGAAVPGQSQSLTATPAPGVDKVKVVGKLPKGVSVKRNNQLQLSRGYKVRRTSKKRAVFQSPKTGNTRSGKGTIECDGCCSLAVTDEPPKAYCQKDKENCGCSTTITIDLN
ncbi:MAG: hypothetical protein ACR2OR_04295 [Hyphomicrobiales bacterium]